MTRDPKPEKETPCDCHRCNGERLFEASFAPNWLTARMILCPDCGNKRCPKASDHRLACTKSNEPGQEGSVYA